MHVNLQIPCFKAAFLNMRIKLMKTQVIAKMKDEINSCYFLRIWYIIKNQ